MIIVVQKGLLFVLLSEMSPVSRIDSYLTNAKMPWEKEAPPVQNIFFYKNKNNLDFDTIKKRSLLQLEVWNYMGKLVMINLNLKNYGILLLKVKPFANSGIKLLVN